MEARQFVANRVEKIREHTAVEWRHVNTEENPADLARRGGSVGDKDSWWNGPTWLKDMEEWPPEIAQEQSRRENPAGGIEAHSS